MLSRSTIMLVIACTSAILAAPLSHYANKKGQLRIFNNRPNSVTLVCANKEVNTQYAKLTHTAPAKSASGTNGMGQSANVPAGPRFCQCTDNLPGGKTQAFGFIKYTQPHSQTIDLDISACKPYSNEG